MLGRERECSQATDHGIYGAHYLSSMVLRCLLVFGLTFFGASLQAQDTLMYVYGTVRDYLTREPLANVLLTTFDVEDPSTPIITSTNRRGEYEVNLMEERVYTILFAAAGYYLKSVEIALPGPSPEDWQKGYAMNLEMMLLPIEEGLDLWGDGQPVGKARYVAKSDIFEWDLAYTKVYSARFADAMKEYKARLKEKE